MSLHRGANEEVTCRRRVREVRTCRSESLRQKIETGQITEALPSQAALMSAYNVSRSTIERALSALKAEGVIESVQGLRRFCAAASPQLLPPIVWPLRPGRRASRQYDAKSVELAPSSRAV
ncbi:GntR family transcriptional regulator [Streptomyces avermitilis]|uniref:GntR family transcriptional regulator n=1 Tax=Streptomyces avermitilis TaxID=33903 RepID=UPI0038037495